MIAIQVAAGFLTLAPELEIELQRNNPFLTKDIIPGEHSLELSVSYTEENCRLLGLLYNYSIPRQKIKIDATMYDGTAFAYRGKLVIDRLESGDLNNPQAAVLTGYFICGATSFYNDIKDVYLKDINYGAKTYTWTTDKPYDGSGGFWQHAHDTWTNSLHGYVFYPVRNEGWGGDGSTIDYMNKILKLNGYYQLSVADNENSLCPHLYLVFVLRKIFEQYGYTLSGDALLDADFLTLTLVTFRACKWRYSVATSPVGTTITMDPAQHVPPKKKVTDLIIELQQYFAITVIIDPVNRTAELTPLKNVPVKSARKDWTQYAHPKWQSDFSEEKKVYAIKPTMEDGDSFAGGTIDLTTLQLLPPVERHSDLDNLRLNQNVGLYCYVFRDNIYYQLTVIGPAFVWAPTYYGPNTYEPANATDSFDSNMSTLAMVWEETFSYVVGQPDYYKLLPACNQEGNWNSKPGGEIPWGFRLLFYKGMAAEYTEKYGLPDPYVPGIAYPYATHTANDAINYSIPTGAWALPMQYKNPISNQEFGVVAYWWRQWLNLLEAGGEIITEVLHLPRYELQQHKWTDIILIRNVPFLVQSIKETLPYPGFVTTELRRIG